MLKSKLVVLILPLFWLFALPTHAEDDEASRMSHDSNYVERAILTSAVENREPVDDLGHHYTHSGDEYDRIAFFTHMINHDGRGISHRWYRNGELDAEVTLAVGSNSWRTYSSRQISHLSTGEWTIRVVNDRGDELVTYHFDVQR